MQLDYTPKLGYVSGNDYNKVSTCVFSDSSSRWLQWVMPFTCILATHPVLAQKRSKLSNIAAKLSMR